MTSLNLRPKRIDVPADVRRALVRMGRTASIQIFSISDFNYVEAVSPCGRLQEKTIEKMQKILNMMTSSSSPPPSVGEGSKR